MLRIKLFGRDITGDRLKNMYVLFTIRQGQGSGYISRLQEIFVLGGMFKLLVPSIPMWQLPVLGVGYMIFTYFIGYYDETRVKMFQAMREKNDQHANPFIQRMERRMVRLEKHFGIDQGDDKNFKHTGK